MDNISMTFYLVLASISLLCEGILLYGYIRLRQIKYHPEILIFWQSLSQLIMDMHWFTGIEQVKNYFSNDSCRYIGAISIYFYFLSWDYTTLLSIEIFIKFRHPENTNYEKRRLWYHLGSHLTSLAVLLWVVIGQDNDGESIMKTCFSQESKTYELAIMAPALLHFPICVVITGYSWYISYGTFYRSCLKYHMLVVAAFIVGWVPIAIVHGLSYENFDIHPPEWIISTSIFLGASSGALIFIARMMQKGLLIKIIDSILHPKKFVVIYKKNSLCTELQPDKIPEFPEGSYAGVFKSVTVRVRPKKAINNILLGISTVLINSENSSQEQGKTLGHDHRDWNLTSKWPEQGKFIITQYNIINYEKIMKQAGISYQELYNSLNAPENYENIESRSKSKGGKSGAFFYFTSDRELMLKTIKEEELDVLKEMIKDYSERITSEPCSYLSKIFGAYKIKIENCSTVRVVLMENLLSRMENPIMFDLKGSKKNRKFSMTKYNDVDSMPRNRVYKDLDFMDVVTDIQFETFEIPEVLESIELDTELLRKYKLMDYSLLMGLDDRTFLNCSMCKGNKVFKFGKYSILIGIIDYFQAYNIKKKIEKGYKMLKSKSEEVSVMSPEPYRARFMNLMRDIFSTSNKLII